MLANCLQHNCRRRSIHARTSFSDTVVGPRNKAFLPSAAPEAVGTPKPGSANSTLNQEVIAGKEIKQRQESAREQQESLQIVA